MSFCGVFSGSKGAHPSYYVASGRWYLVSYLHVRLQGNWLRFGYQLPGAMGNGHHCNMQLIGSIVAAVCRTLIIFSKDEKSSGVIAIVQVHCMGSYMHTHQATGDPVFTVKLLDSMFFLFLYHFAGHSRVTSISQDEASVSATVSFGLLYDGGYGFSVTPLLMMPP